MQRYFKEHGRPGDIDGFSPEQRFFLSWAQVWRHNIRKENAETRLVTDPHSPGDLRVNGPLKNVPEFFEAFKIEEGARMFITSEEQVEIW